LVFAIIGEMGLDELPCNVFVPAAVPDRIPRLAFDDAVV